MYGEHEDGGWTAGAQSRAKTARDSFGMIDVHCHMLPSVDDGAANEEDALLMAQVAQDSGVAGVVLTPHCNVPGQFDNRYDAELKERFGSFEQLLRREGYTLNVYRGMEVFATDELPKLLDVGQLITLGGGKHLLVEFAFGEEAYFADDMLKCVRSYGLTPVIAHPERYYFIQDDPRHLLHWMNKGYVLQLNKGSFFGMFGRHAAKTAHWCLDCGCLHVIGSDAHSPYRRTPRLSDIFSLVEENVSTDTATLLLQDNPKAILNGGEVLPAMAHF